MSVTFLDRHTGSVKSQHYHLLSPPIITIGGRSSFSWRHIPNKRHESGYVMPLMLLGECFDRVKSVKSVF